MKDILYKEEDFIFSYRVGGVLIRDGKILLQKSEDNEYAIIGGHVACMETTEETIRREYEEELHASVEVERLIAVGEVYFLWRKRRCHQICLYYRVRLTDENAMVPDGVFHGFDEIGKERIDLAFCWVPLEDIRNGLKVYPQELMPGIISESRDVLHFVSKQI